MKTTKRTLLAAGIFAALLPLGAGAAGITTDVDRVIDLIVAQRVANQNLSATEARVAREQLQLQYIAMSPAARARIQASARGATSDDGVARVAQTFNNVVADAARQQVTDAAKDRLGTATGDGQLPEMKPKLGADGDLVFVATAGPCRVADTRLNIIANWPGPVTGFTGRQIWAYSSFAGYNFNDFQGGTGIAGAGNCVGTVYGGVSPVSVVATVAVVNTFSTGYLRAWNGGTTLTVGGILGWNAGDVLSNTTVIPLDRSILEYPGSGPYKRDFAVYNNSAFPVDVIVDVVGYFIENQATPLECTTLTSAPYAIGANAFTSGASPACGAGYTRVVTTCFPSDYFVNMVGVSGSTCYMRNESAAAKSFEASSVCCRVPGR